jgi:hypothetical protein
MGLYTTATHLWLVNYNQTTLPGRSREGGSGGPPVNPNQPPPDLALKASATTVASGGGHVPAVEGGGRGWRGLSSSFAQGATAQRRRWRPGGGARGDASCGRCSPARGREARTRRMGARWRMLDGGGGCPWRRSVVPILSGVCCLLCCRRLTQSGADLVLI